MSLYIYIYIYIYIGAFVIKSMQSCIETYNFKLRLPVTKIIAQWITLKRPVEKQLLFRDKGNFISDVSSLHKQYHQRG